MIVTVAKRLDAGRFPPFQIGLQFVQIGDDDRAAEFLQSLDDDLSKKHGIRDFVDCTPFTATNGGRIDAEFIKKALLGGVNRKIDRQG